MRAKDIQSTELLCEAIIRAYGGINNVAEYVREAIYGKNDSHAATVFTAFMHLLEVKYVVDQRSKESRRLAEKQFSRMSPDELQSVLNSTCLDIIRRRPTIAAARLEQLGWMCVSPSQLKKEMEERERNASNNGTDDDNEPAIDSDEYFQEEWE